MLLNSEGNDPLQVPAGPFGRRGVDVLRPLHFLRVCHNGFLPSEPVVCVVKGILYWDILAFNGSSL